MEETYRCISFLNIRLFKIISHILEIQQVLSDIEMHCNFPSEQTIFIGKLNSF